MRRTDPKRTAEQRENGTPLPPDPALPEANAEGGSPAADGKDTEAAARDPAEERAKERARRRRRRLRALRSLVLQTVGLALVMYVLFFHVVGLTVMPTADMYPRVDAGDLVLFYRLEHTFKAQDIVVFDKAVTADYRAVDVPAREKPWWRKAADWLGIRDPEDPETKRFVCRIIAAPGDSVEVTEDQRLIVNGNGMIESGIFYPTAAYAGYTEYPVRLGPGEYFVMADFRSGGADSRFFGPVREEEIRGIVITILRRNNL